MDKRIIDRPTGAKTESACRRFLSKIRAQTVIYFVLIFCILSGHAFALQLSPEEQAFISQDKVIKVHNESDWPPFNFNEYKQEQGLSIDVMNEIAGMTGLNVEYITGPSWNEFLGMMRDGELDVMLNIVDLPERREELRFTTTYAKSLSGIYTTSENSTKYFELDDLKGKTIAVPSGFDLEIKLAKYYPEINIVTVKDIIECIEAIHSGLADAFMEEIGVVDYIMSQRMVTDLRIAFQVNEEVFISDLHIATSRGNDLLFSIIQKGLNAIPEEELYRLRKKWLLNAHKAYEQSMVSLSVLEKEYLFDNPQVRICVDPSWPPLDFIDVHGEHSGLSADLINKLSSRIGFDLKLVPTDSWEETLNSIRDNRCDVIPLMNETEESKDYIDFTQPYFQFATVIATRDKSSFIADYTDLYGKKVALQAYYFITDFVRENHPQIEIIEVADTREALKMVSEQKAFATIDGLPNIVNSVEALALENIKIAGSVPQENRMKLGVSKGKEHLLSVFNKGIASLSEQEKISLYKKWFDIEVTPTHLDYRWLLRIALVVAIVFVFLLWRQFTLSKYAAKLKRLNEKLRYISSTDHLTNILNRRSIEKQLSVEIERVRSVQKPLSVLLLDIDYFKNINDTYGHLTGDEVLKEIAKLLSNAIRDGDSIGRWGGEEFLIVLPETTHQKAETVAKQLKELIAINDFGLEARISASFGVAQVHGEESRTELLARTDKGLYQAKEQGRNLVVSMEKHGEKD